MERGTELAVEAEPSSSFWRVASGSFGLQEPLLVSVEGVPATLGGVNPETDIAAKHKAKSTSRTTMSLFVRDKKSTRTRVMEKVPTATPIKRRYG